MGVIGIGRSRKGWSALTTDVVKPIYTESWRIASQTHDATEYVGDGSVDLWGPSTPMCYDGEQTLVGLYFKDASFLIPKGSVIKDAYVQFTSKTTTSSSVTFKIRVQKSSNVLNFSDTTNDISSRALTNREVTWIPGTWTAESRTENERTVNIAAIIQEIIDGPDYKIGDGIVLVISTDSPTTNVREPYFGTSAPTKAPELFVTFQGYAGGFAGDREVLKAWEWQHYPIVEADQSGNPLSANQLFIDSEANINQVSNSGNRVSFYVDPNNPDPAGWSSQDNNYRAELRTNPWNVQHPLGTEEWFGWTYEFGPDYLADENCDWGMFQIHNGVVDADPLIALQVLYENQISGNTAGEIFVVNSSNVNEYTGTGIIPVAGQKLKIVLHVVYGNNDSDGKLKVWIDGDVVYNASKRNTLAGYDYGGNAKWGIYKYSWQNNPANIALSAAQGIYNVQTYLHALKMITRRIGDDDYGVSAYDLVKP